MGSFLLIRVRFGSLNCCGALKQRHYLNESFDNPHLADTLLTIAPIWFRHHETPQFYKSSVCQPSSALLLYFQIECRCTVPTSDFKTCLAAKFDQCSISIIIQRFKLSFVHYHCKAQKSSLFEKILISFVTLGFVHSLGP